MNQVESYLTFRVGENFFGVHVNHVSEIMEYMAVKSQPASLPYLKGLIEHRGEVMPLIDTGVKFGQQPMVVSDNTCIVVLQIREAGELFSVALLADQVSDVVEADSSILLPIRNAYKPGYICASLHHNEKLVLVMDADKVFTDTDIIELHAVMSELNIA